jgi:hypothetical protein
VRRGIEIRFRERPWLRLPFCPQGKDGKQQESSAGGDHDPGNAPSRRGWLRSAVFVLDLACWNWLEVIARHQQQVLQPPIRRESTG